MYISVGSKPSFNEERKRIISSDANSAYGQNSLSFYVLMFIYFYMFIRKWNYL